MVAEARRGFRAAPVSAEDLRDLVSIQIDIETSSLQRAIALGDVEWEIGIIAAFHCLSRTAERADGDAQLVAEEWANARREFHAALVGACGSCWRLRLRSFLFDQSKRYRRAIAACRLPRIRRNRTGWRSTG